MQMSHQGLKLLEQREGERLRAYRDSRGVWTIGIGHSSQAGAPPAVHPGDVITEGRALQILAGDLAPRERFLTGLLKRQASQNQFDAFLSLMFNIGNGAFEHSRVLALFNAGDVHGAAQAFLDFCHPSVLHGRRVAEMHQFLS